jgi:hypothetical protein
MAQKSRSTGSNPVRRNQPKQEARPKRQPAGSKGSPDSLRRVFNAIRNTQGIDGHPLSRPAFRDFLDSKWCKRGARYGISTIDELYYRAAEIGAKDKKPYPLNYPLMEAYANALSVPLAAILFVSRLTALKKHIDDSEEPKTSDPISPEQIVAGMRALCDYYDEILKDKSNIDNKDIRHFLDAFWAANEYPRSLSEDDTHPSV